MKGGTITDNTTMSDRGVVYVMDSTARTPSLVKKTGGTVTDNTNNSITMSSTSAKNTTVEGWN
jgi:hypothetical protein